GLDDGLSCGVGEVVVRADDEVGEDVLGVEARQDASAVITGPSTVGACLTAAGSVGAWNVAGDGAEQVLLLAGRRGYDPQTDLGALYTQGSEGGFHDGDVGTLEPVAGERRWDRDPERAVLEADGLCLL